MEESFHESTETETYICSICGKEFARKWGLTRHERTHNESHKLLCGICQKTFSNREYYEGHINNHHGLKPHACLKCNTRYAYKSSLLRHTMHCGQKQASEADPVFQCDICQQRFTRKDGLQDHIHGKHEGIARYTYPHIFASQGCFSIHPWQNITCFDFSGHPIKLSLLFSVFKVMAAPCDTCFVACMQIR